MFTSFYSSVTAAASSTLSSNTTAQSTAATATSTTKNTNLPTKPTSESLTDRCKQVCESLTQLEFIDQRNWISDLQTYFISEEFSSDVSLSNSNSASSSSTLTLILEEINTFFTRIASVTSTVSDKPSSSGYFNFYVSSYFKDTQKEKDNKELISSSLKQLLSSLHAIYTNLQKPHKCVLIAEFISLHPSLDTTYESIKSNKHAHHHSNSKPQKAFVSAAAQFFMEKFFPNIISDLQDDSSNINHPRKIFWQDFSAALATHYHELIDSKRRTPSSLNFPEIITYMKPLIDTNHDNTIDLSEIDTFFTSYNCLTPSHLISAIDSARYKPLYPHILTIEMTKYPENFSDFYLRTGDSAVKMTVNPFQQQPLVIGRKNDKANLDKSTAIFGAGGTGVGRVPPMICFPPSETKISRQQLSIVKDDMGSYFLENIHFQNPIYFKVNSMPTLVKEGAVFYIGKKTPTYNPPSFAVESLQPSHETYKLGRSVLHPIKDLPLVELAADLQIAKSCVQSVDDDVSSSDNNNTNFQARFIYKNVSYLCSKKRFTVGKTVSDDIQIDQAEKSQIVFEYLDGYGWVVSSSPQYNTFMRIPDRQAAAGVNQQDKQSQQNRSEEDKQMKDKSQIGGGTAAAAAGQSLKFRIYNGLSISLEEYECTFTLS